MSSITITTSSFGAINSTVTGQAPATITLQIGTPGPQGQQGTQGIQGPQGPAGPAGTSSWGSISGSISSQTDLSNALAGKYSTSNPSGFITSSALSPYLTTSTASSTYAPLASPALTGTPTAPTALTADSSTTIATTAFVKAQGYLTSAPVTSVAGRTGAVTLANTDISGLGTMSTASAADYSTTTVASGLYYPLAGNPSGFLTSAPVSSVAGRTGAVTLSTTDISGISSYAPIASPTFTGTVTIPTGASISGYLTTSTASSTYAPLASPTFTGTVTIPTGASIQGSCTINSPTFTLKATFGNPSTTTGSALINLGSVAGSPFSSSIADLWFNSSVYKIGYRDSSANQLVASESYVSTNYAPKASPTFTGTVTIPAGASISGFATLASPTFTGTVTIPSGASISGFATLASPTFTGTPLSVTAAVDTNTTQIATTAYVVGQGYAKLTSPTLTGTPLSVTAAADTNTTQIATTAFVVGQASATTPVVDGTATIGTSLKYARADHVHPTDTTRAPLASPTFTGTVTIPSGASISGFAPLASPTFTGTPLSVTAAADTNTTQIATTAFVVGQASATTPVIDGTATIGTSLKFARADHVHPTDTTRAPLASPTFTGTPLSTTAAVSTNTTQIATTAFVVGQAGTASPVVNGTATVGTSLLYSRQDHVHATDTTRAPLASPTFTGTVTIPSGASISGFAPLASPTFTGVPAGPTAAAATNTTQLATTAFVTAAVPAFAATSDTNAPSSTTKVTSPSNVLDMILHNGYQALYYGASSSATSGAGSAISVYSRWHDMYGPNNATSGYVGWCTDSSASSGWVGYGRGLVYLNKPWAKKIWMAGRSQIGAYSGSGGMGDTNNTFRVSLGGKNALSAGANAAYLDHIGWTCQGGGSAVVYLVMGNAYAAAPVTVATTFTPVAGQIFDWKIFSDGAGNVTFWINDVQQATSTSGPFANSNNGLYYEMVDGNGSQAGGNAVFANYGTKLFISV